LSRGIVLFAHGSRDSSWSKPFEALASSIKALTPDAEVVIAFLETMEPSLEDAVHVLTRKGVSLIRIVPVFLAAGAHVREDLPKLLARVRALHPGVDIRSDPPIGEEPAIIEAIAAFISRRGDQSSP
jgi:sirohydrochlorin cobaltochelatase